MRRNPLLLPLALLFCLVLGTAPGMAQDVTAEALYKKMFTEPLQVEWFAPEVPAEEAIPQLEEIVAQYIAVLGEFEGAEGTAPNYRLTFTNGYTSSQLFLNAEGKILGIWFGMPEPKVSGLDEAAEGFADLPGEVSLLVVSDQGMLLSANPEKPMAVGSAFKLAILAAIMDQVNAGLLAWDDVVTLEPGDKSLPTGILQEFPDGTALTIETLAALMISMSDNTATDMLLRVAGREFVEMYAPNNVPLLGTREVFALNNPENAELLAAYREGDVAQRRALLEQLAEAPLPEPAAFTNGPNAMDIEWHFSALELANLIAYVHELPLMAINPGVASADDWEYVAFKGGSMPGVINLTTLLVSESGSTYIVIGTWNNPEAAVDEMKFVTLYSGLIEALKQLEAQ